MSAFPARSECRRIRLEILAEVFDVPNRRNWIGHEGNQNSSQFGRPTAAAGARDVQLGVRVEY
jgi:hypothetical protein